MTNRNERHVERPTWRRSCYYGRTPRCVRERDQNN